MLYKKNKAQIARESIKNSKTFQGPSSGPWTPAVKDFWAAHFMKLVSH